MTWNVRNVARAFSAVAMGITLVTAGGARLVTAAEANPTDAAPEAGKETVPGKGGGTGMGGGRGRGGGGGRGGTAPQEKAADGAPLKLETIKGEVIQVDGATPGEAGGAGGRSKGTRPTPMISVRTESETISVHAGAPHFRQEQKLDLKVGDVIEITGTRGTKSANTFVAHSITRGSQVVRLRDPQGNKLWKPRQRANEPELTEIKARVVSLDVPAAHSPGSGLGRNSQFIVVRRDKEDLAIEVGPAEYRQAQGLTLAVDEELTISGWRLPSAQTAGKPIVLAASITQGKKVVKLRDDRRRPLWRNQK